MAWEIGFYISRKEISTMTEKQEVKQPKIKVSKYTAMLGHGKVKPTGGKVDQSNRGKGK